MAELTAVLGVIGCRLLLFMHLRNLKLIGGPPSHPAAGDQQRLQLAYDVVATTMPHGHRRLQLLGTFTGIRLHRNRLWCIWVLFTLLAFLLVGRALEQRGRSAAGFLAYGFRTSSCFEPGPCTVRVSMAAACCNEKRSGFGRVMFCVLTSAYTDGVRASARHV